MVAVSGGKPQDGGKHRRTIAQNSLEVQRRLPRELSPEGKGSVLRRKGRMLQAEGSPWAKLDEAEQHLICGALSIPGAS